MKTGMVVQQCNPNTLWGSYAGGLKAQAQPG